MIDSDKVGDYQDHEMMMMVVVVVMKSTMKIIVTITMMVMVIRTIVIDTHDDNGCEMVENYEAVLTS